MGSSIVVNPNARLVDLAKRYGAVSRSRHHLGNSVKKLSPSRRPSYVSSHQKQETEQRSPVLEGYVMFLVGQE